ncbi:MAG: hypothetical protein GTN64_08485 [Candidatus Latescibacteria bacterium]|nr:hypothetical protein [Candidatus Latescibacterota bacterium]NIO78638.1 hypothetical protein [Candidatus Latescibacterota bacterium]
MMICCPAKSGQYYYYTCNSHFRQGKHACDSKSVAKDMLEAFVIERLKQNLLTEENLAELVKLTNEEIKQGKSQYREKLLAIDAQLEALKGKLDKLYDALESGMLDLSDLAPRIKEMKSQIDKLENTRADLADGKQR